MGYRSEVAYAIQFKDADALKEFVGLHAINEDTREALNECELSNDDQPALLFKAEDVKWYDNFEEVQAHNKLLDSVDEAFDDRAGYYYLRLGEESDDNEEKQGGFHELIPWDAFNFRRYIQWEWGGDVPRTGDDLIGTISKL